MMALSEQEEVAEATLHDKGLGVARIAQILIADRVIVKNYVRYLPSSSSSAAQGEGDRYCRWCAGLLPERLHAGSVFCSTEQRRLH